MNPWLDGSATVDGVGVTYAILAALFLFLVYVTAIERKIRGPGPGLVAVIGALLAWNAARGGVVFEAAWRFLVGG